MPEWYLFLALLLPPVALGAWWRPPLLVFGPILALALLASIAQAAKGAIRASAPPELDTLPRLGYRIVVGALHLVQPAARLRGRLTQGLTIWRRRGLGGWSWLTGSERALWSETWHAPSSWVEALDRCLTRDRIPVLRAGPFERWDLEVRGGPVGRVRVLTATEEHGQGKQLVRVRLSPRVRALPTLLLAVLAGSITIPSPGEPWLPSALFLLGAVLFLGLAMLDVGCAQATILNSLRKVAGEKGAVVMEEASSSDSGKRSVVPRPVDGVGERRPAFVQGGLRH
jgi:hypothetical protein